MDIESLKNLAELSGSGNVIVNKNHEHVTKVYMKAKDARAHQDTIIFDQLYDKIYKIINHPGSVHIHEHTFDCITPTIAQKFRDLGYKVTYVEKDSTEATVSW